MRAFELLETRRPIVEGGNVFPDVGAIHISEVEPTLNAIGKYINYPQASQQALGSVGKMDYSGDIDIALDVSPEEVKAMQAKMIKKLGADSVKMVSGNLTLRFPISNYDESQQERQPRTGFVQVDLIPGDVDWMRTFFHSPGKGSQYKGAHRNLALATVAALLDSKESEELDSFDRPVSTERWSWGKKDGLQKIRRYSVEKDGKWLKGQKSEALNKPTRNPDEIAKILFKGKAGADALNSLESIIDAVKKAYSPEEQETIFGRMAWSLGTRDMDANLPPELEPYKDAS